jgi:Mrp family chromosome partitioning ATPase
MRILVKSLARWFWLLILCVLVGYFGGKELSVLLPPNYQATSLVQLDAQTRTSLIVQPVAAYAALVTSDAVLNPVLAQHPDIDRTNFIAKQLTVSSDDPSATVTIQVTLPNAKEAALVANALAQLLVTQQNAYIKSQYTTELQLLTTRIANEQKTIASLNQQIAQTPTTSSATIQQLSSQITQQQNLQNQDISTQQSLVTEQALYSQPLSVVQSATVPTKPSSIIGLIPITPVTLIVLVALGIAVVSFLEQRAGRINGIMKLQQKVALPVVGSLRWTRPSPSTLPIETLSEMPYAEDCRVMMADVLFQAEEKQARILAVTSIKEHAGSSTVAAQLATLLAQSKRRILLIDANLRSPSLHKRMGVQNNNGLGSLLEEVRAMKISVPPRPEMADVSMQETSSVRASERRTLPNYFGARSTQRATDLGVPVITHSGQTLETLDTTDANGKFEHNGNSIDFPFERYIMSTSVPNLFMLSAGTAVVNPSSLLSMPEMSLLLKSASRPIDFVIIDCPALVHAEAHILGALSDQTLLVVDSTRDRIHQVASAREELRNTGLRIAGLVVNKLWRWL